MLSNLLQLTVLALSSLAVAQDLSVDVNWRVSRDSYRVDATDSSHHVLQKFSNSRPQSERISIAQNAINAIIPQLNPATGEFKGIGYWQSGNVYSAIALQDQLTKTTTNQATVVNNLKKVFQLRKNYDQFGWVVIRCIHSLFPELPFQIQRRCLVSPIICTEIILATEFSSRWWATASYYAYRAYGDSALLANAVATWNAVTP